MREFEEIQGSFGLKNSFKSRKCAFLSELKVAHH